MVETNRTVTYDLVTLNQGGGLNAATGAFVAPVSGIYFFSYVDTTLATSIFTAVKIYKNNVVVAAAYTHSYDKPWIVQGLSVKATLSLDPGDEVTVREYVDGKNPPSKPPGRLNTTLVFTGFLVNGMK